MIRIAIASTISSSSGDGFGSILVIGLVLVVVVVAAMIIAIKKTKRISPEQLSAEAKEFFDKIMATKKITVPETPLIMERDENALLHEQSKLIEARATRVYAGVGTRVKGIYIGGGQSSSVQRLKELDSGTLTLTTKRLVFTGSMESRVVNVKDIVSAEARPGGVEISAGKKAKRQVYLVRNPIIWAMLIRMVTKGELSAALIKPAEPSTDIRFNCPRCGQHLSVEKRGAGTAVNCPNCNEQIEIPGSTVPPLPQPS